MSVRHRAALLALAPVLVLVSVVGISAPAEAAGTQIYGRLTDSSTHHTVARMKVLLFDASWGYLRSVNASSGGVYAIPVPGSGSYHLQVVDRRPAYDTSSYARRLDVRVSVGSTSKRQDVRVTRGGSIGGTIRARGNRAAGALVRIVSDAGQVYEVRANQRGQYAVGGLGRDGHRVYAYDPKKVRVGPSKRVPLVRRLSYHSVSFDLRSRASAYTGFLTLGGDPATKTVTVTAVNQRTGEYWVQKVVHGDLSLRGLTAGRYRLRVPDTDGWFGGEFSLQNLPTGRTRDGSVNLTVQGGVFVGTVVDATTSKPLKNATVRLTDAQGRTQSEVLTSSTGTFSIGGSLRAQSGVTITVLTYGKIDDHEYTSQTFTDQSITDHTSVDLGQIKLQRTAVPVVPPVVTPPVVPPVVTPPVVPPVVVPTVAAS